MSDQNANNSNLAEAGRQGEENPKAGAFWRWLRLGVLGLAVLFTLLFLLFQLPFVQNWMVDRVTRTLSQTLNTRVSIDEVRLSWMNRLKMENIYIEDFNCDTLLYGNHLYVDFTTNPLTLLRQGLTVERLELYGARFNLRRLEGEYRNNLQSMLEKLFAAPGERKRDRKPFQMVLRSLNLRDVRFLQEDLVRGKREAYYVGDGYFRIEEMDLPGHYISLKRVRLKQPEIQLEKYPENPITQSLGAALADADTSRRDTLGWRFEIDKFKLSEGLFTFDNYQKAPEKRSPPDQLDYDHLNVFDINIDIENFSFDNWLFQGHLRGVTLEEKSGFVLNELSADDALVGPESTQLNGMRIVTPYSQIGDTLIFEYDQYEDYTDFPDRVEMDGRLNQARVAIRDIIKFAPGLNDNAFFRANRSEVIRIDGQMAGQVNNLRGRNLNLQLADGSRLVGRFNSRNLAKKNEEILNLRLQRLQTSMPTLRQLVPNLDLPSNFDKLGQLDFSGSFDGFFSDFVAYGDLRTDLGRAQLDMQMKLQGGRTQARYSGEMSLERFDLGRWTGDDNFGEVTISGRVIDGQGLTGESANATLTAQINSLVYRGYFYENAQIEGALKRNRFDGAFSIKDDNIDFNFNGEINLSREIPTYEFEAAVNKLDLQNLNLTKRQLVMGGAVDLNLRNKTLSELEGNLSVRNLRINHRGEEQYQVDSVVIESEFTDSTGNKRFSVDSDLMQANIEGRFDVTQLPDALLQYFVRNYPAFAKKLGIPAADEPLKPHQFGYDIRLTNSKGINRLFAPALDTLKNLRLRGYYDNQKDSLLVDVSAPRLQLGQVEMEDIVLIFDALQGAGTMDFAVDSTTINGKTGFSPIIALSILNQDTIQFGLNYATPTRSYLDNLNLNGQLFIVDSTDIQLEFDQSNLVILESIWNIEADNYVRIGQDTIDTQHFQLQRGDKRIRLETLGARGLKLSLLEMDFADLNPLLAYDPLQFSGHYDIYAQVNDVFNLQELHFTASADTLFINGDDWGKLRLDVRGPDLKQPMESYLSLTKGASQILAEGAFNPTTAEVENPTLQQQANYLDFQVTLSGFPLRFGEYFIGKEVSGITGAVDAKLRVNGLPEKPNIGGNITIADGGVTIDYLQTHYRFDQALIQVDNQIFDATGVRLFDRYGHPATIYGGIRHDHLRDFRIAAKLSTSRFLALDTEKEDNELFYGHALGKGEIWFTGDFQRTDIYANATVGDSTEFIIPVSSERDASDISFVRFVDKNVNRRQTEPSNNPDELRGVRLEMDLTITDEAVAKIVFDEQAGDIIEGAGRGDIQIIVPRTGDFSMYGNYIIEEGDYLFTLYNLVNKDFRIRKGGRINWDGDPFGATIDLEAEYKDLEAPVANFLTEYLASAEADLKNEASKPTQVNLTMDLEGQLLQPVINFDIGFPNLRGQLQNFTESKLRLLKQDQNELNKQVFGLIVAGQFIPSGFSNFQGSEILYNTVSEFLSNQLSLLITELFSEFIGEGEVLSSIDFDIAYNQYQSVDLGDGQNVNRGDELQLRLKQNFFNDRLSILVGGDIDIGGAYRATTGTSGTFVGNDLVIEYMLNRDRSLKLRVYQLLEPDVGGGRRLEIGTGLSFRREFNSFSQFLNSLKLAFSKTEKPAS